MSICFVLFCVRDITELFLLHLELLDITYNMNDETLVYLCNNAFKGLVCNVNVKLWGYNSTVEGPPYDQWFISSYLVSQTTQTFITLTQLSKYGIISSNWVWLWYCKSSSLIIGLISCIYCCVLAEGLYYFYLRTRYRTSNSFPGFTMLARLARLAVVKFNTEQNDN